MRLEFGDDRLPGDFWDRVSPVPHAGCWLWVGAIKGKGYSSFRGEYGHRVAVVAERGPIPAGLHVDHLCRTRACVNPSHLEAVTCRENLLRGDTVTARAAAATHCPQGHAYEGDNLYVSPRGDRGCMECRRVARRASYHRTKRCD